LRIFTLIIIFIVCSFYGCDKKTEKPDEAAQDSIITDSAMLTLEFTLDVIRNTYEYTTYGEPPQLAIWIEHSDSDFIQTVWVSNRAGKNEWKGKVECPVALPYWDSRHKFEKSGFRERNIFERLVDAISGATPTGGEFSTSVKIPECSRWSYFIEVNASGDYNRDYSYWSKDGLPDSEGNGQPSIIYRGYIEADSTNISVPELIGRTLQRVPVDSVIPDLAGITTAKELIQNIEVKIN
jgi:hypothetical protein